MSPSLFFKKAKNKLWGRLVKYTRQNYLYPFIYLSYWYSLFNGGNKKLSTLNYYTAIPNRGAGIGHQLANWIAGYWFASQFKLPFAHMPFSNNNWEHLLGFGENECTVASLLNKGYKKVTLPLFDEYNESEVFLQKKIIASYANKKVVFVAEQDQGYQNQFGVINQIQKKFYNATARKNDKLIYSKSNYNIAIHIRRGDIVIGQQNQNQNLVLRWQGNEYFTKVLHKVLQNKKTNKHIAIYLFSQGESKDFPEFEKFPNLNFCLDMNAQDSFLHMVFADVLITSKSSFSYKPALLNKGIKICPLGFWHGYPDTKDWIIADENGNFNSHQFQNLTNE